MRDKELVKILGKIEKAKPAKVRGELLAAGVDLALDGFPREAVALFDVAGEQEKHPHESLFHERAVAGLRVALGLDGSAAAKKAVAEADASMRAQLLTDAFGMKKPGPKKGLPPAGADRMQIIDWYRRAQLADEARRLEILRALLASPEVSGTLRDDAGLLVADALARAGEPAAAEALAAFAEGAGSSKERALVLRALAGLVAAGALRSRSQLSARAVADLVKKAKSLAAKPRTNVASTHTVSTLYSQFYLEPRKPKDQGVYFQGDGEVQRGYSLLGDKVGLTTPEESESCKVTLQVSAPPRKIAGTVLRFPLKVAGDLYLRTVAESADDHRFAVPPGRYDVTVSFKRNRKSNAYGNHYDVGVWLAHS